MNQVTAYAIGTEVELYGHGAAVLVTAVTLREGGKLTYEVVWWSNGSRCLAWVEACELRPLPTPGVVAFGFASQTPGAG